MILLIKTIIPSLILYIIIIGIYRIIDNKINNKQYQLKDIIYLFYIIYFIILIHLVTIKNILTYEPINNFIPGKQILRYRITSYLFFKNVIGNILLFIPFGSFFNNIFHLKKRIMILITVVFSMCIEIIQVLIGRVFDIDDILLNVLGSLIGSFL